MSAALIITNARGPDGAAMEALIVDGRFAAVRPDASIDAPPDAERYDARGRLLLPGLIEGHVHLDKTLIGLPFVSHIPGATIASRIAAERALRRSVLYPSRRAAAFFSKNCRPWERSQRAVTSISTRRRGSAASKPS